MFVQSSRGNDEVEGIKKETYFEHCAEIIAEEIPNSESEYNTLFLLD
jgi:hypothetical protein